MGAVDIFFELLQVYGGSRDRLSVCPDDDLWLEVCSIASDHRMLGIAFAAMDRLPKEQCPSKRPMVRMYSEAEKIKRLNDLLDKAVPQAVEYFASGGFRSVLLKGQGLARLYPVGSSRTPGDIDLWVAGSRKAISSLVRRTSPSSRTCYHHIECQQIGGCDLEAHFTPSWMFSPIHNARLQRWFSGQFEVQSRNLSDFGGVQVAVADAAFNRIYILLHIFRHLFDEGVGLRQVQDYLYVLRQGFTEAEKAETVALLGRFGLRRFASALMYVLQKVFALEDEYLLVEPRCKEGRFLLDEILRSGNFGACDEASGRRSHLESLEFLRRMRRIVRFARYYPLEVVGSPFFKIYNYFIRHLI